METILQYDIWYYMQIWIEYEVVDSMNKVRVSISIENPEERNNNLKDVACSLNKV